MIDQKLLVLKTIEALKEKGFLDPSEDKLPIRDRNSIWSCIVFKCSSLIDKNESLKIYTSWKRNYKNYQTDVLLLHARKTNLNVNDCELSFANDIQMSPKSLDNHIPDENNDFSLNLSDNSCSQTFNYRLNLFNEKEITFSEFEIPQLLKLVIGTRKKFSQQFTNILTYKLQKLGLNCSLDCKSNYFSLKTSPGNNNYWSGTYYCKTTECDLNFKAVIKTWSLKNLSCKISWNGNCNHERLNRQKSQCRGKYRKQLATEVTAKGTSNFEYSKKYENLIDESYIEFLPTNAVLKTIKSEYKYNARISKDLYNDAEASKILCEKLCLFSHPTQLNGYVQEIGQNPFGILLMSHIQVLKLKKNFYLIMIFNCITLLKDPSMENNT